MRTKVIATHSNEVRDSRWTLVQHDDGSLHVAQEAKYHSDDKVLTRSVPINDFLRENGPPPRHLQKLIDRMFDDG
jgi:hypothetical protein